VLIQSVARRSSPATRGYSSTADAAGVDGTLEVGEGMVLPWHVLAPHVPESHGVITSLAAYLRGSDARIR
jgi:hypothetical protein